MKLRNQVRDLSEVKEVNKSLEIKIAKFEADVCDATESLDTKIMELEAKSEILESVQEKLEKVTTDLENMTVVLAEKEESIKKAVDVEQELKGRMKVAEEMQDGQNIKIAELKENLAAKDRAAMEMSEEVTKLQCQVEDLLTDLGQIKEQQFAVFTECNSLRAAMEEHAAKSSQDAGQVESMKSQMVEAGRKVSALESLATAAQKQVEELSRKVQNKEEAERILKEEVEKLRDARAISTGLETDVEGREYLVKELQNVKEELAEVENQRDIVSSECDKLEGKLKADADVVEALRTELATSEEQVVKFRGRVEDLESEVEHVAELSKQLAEAKETIKDLETNVDRLKYDVAEAEKQRDLVDEVCDGLETKLEDTRHQKEELEKTNRSLLESASMQGASTPRVGHVSMDSTTVFNQTDADEEKRKMMSQLLQQKEYSDRMYELNKQLKSKIQHIEGASSTDVGSKDALEKVKEELCKKKEELGKKNIQYASLKVDVEKGELEYKRKCTILLVCPFTKYLVGPLQVRIFLTLPKHNVKKSYFIDYFFLYFS